MHIYEKQEKIARNTPRLKEKRSDCLFQLRFATVRSATLKKDEYYILPAGR
jgi:hypothetical protein